MAVETITIGMGATPPRWQRMRNGLSLDERKAPCAALPPRLNRFSTA